MYQWIVHHHNHHWAAVVSRCWAKASACRLQVSLCCAVLRQIVSLQYLPGLSLRRLAGLPCRMVSKWWHARSISRLWGSWCAHPRTTSFFSHCWLCLWLLSSPWPRCRSFCLCMWCWAYFFPFWSVRPQVCYVLVWSVSRYLHHMA